MKIEMRMLPINSEIISTLCNSSGSNFNQRRTYPKIDEAEEFLLQRDDVLSSLQQKQKHTQVAIQKNLLKFLKNSIPFFLLGNKIIQ
jgi:Golgi nucleoside diphosphatase